MESTEKIRERLRKKFREAAEKNKKPKFVFNNEPKISRIDEILLNHKDKRIDDLKAIFSKERSDKISGEELREKQYKPVLEELHKVVDAINVVDSDLKHLPITTLNIIEPSKEVTTTGSPGQFPHRLSPGNSQVLGTPRSILDTGLLGETAKQYLEYGAGPYKDIRGFDQQFGVYYDKKFKIGKLEITIDNDSNIRIKNYNHVFKGTLGLWRLITYKKDIPAPGNCDEEDLKNYVLLLILSESIYQNNDKTTNRPKSSTNIKYLKLVKPLHEFIKSKGINMSPEECAKEFVLSQKTGSNLIRDFKNPSDIRGLVELNNKDKEYMIPNSLADLVERLVFIGAEEKAGNNSFHNDKLGIVRFIVRFIKNELEKIIDTPKGFEYLINALSSLSETKYGNGLVNNIINNLPFELHWPGYNYLGPGTKLDERLAKDSKPVNKLDNYAKEHDIFYKNHKSLKDRHKADKILEYKAWSRVKSDDSHISEKIPAWFTTNTMKVKRKLGMGLLY